MEDVGSGPGSALEELMRKVPGFAGYMERERRRDSDRLQREFLARRVSELKATMQVLQEEILAAGNLGLVERLDRVGGQLDRIAERIRHASYGYAGFFDLHKVGEQELDRIYEFDLALVNELASAEEALAALRASLQGEGDPAARLSDFSSRVRDLDARLDERERLLKGVG